MKFKLLAVRFALGKEISGTWVARDPVRGEWALPLLHNLPSLLIQGQWEARAFQVL